MGQIEEYHSTLKDELGDKIDKLTVMMSKLAAKDNHKRKPFKLQIYKSRGQNRSYGQGGYQNRSDSRSRGHFTNNSPRQSYRGNRFRGSSRGYGRQNDRGNYRNERYNNHNRDRSRLRERNFTRNYNNSRDRSSSNSRLRSGSRANTNRDRIRCYACREYDHFMRLYQFQRGEKSGTVATNVKYGRRRLQNREFG